MLLFEVIVIVFVVEVVETCWLLWPFYSCSKLAEASTKRSKQLNDEVRRN